MKLGNVTGADKVWVPFVIAGGAVAAHYGLISDSQVSFIAENAVIFGAMVIQAIAVFWTTNKA
jgi:hypothetical protein